MTDTIIIPSVVGNSQEELAQILDTIKDFDRIQLDVKDGEFVPTVDLNFDFDASSFTGTKEVHLMVKNPRSWIEKYAEKVDVIFIHVEVEDDIASLISLIKSKGKDVGIVLAPYSDVELLFPYIQTVDVIQIFSANKIGYDGAMFDETCLHKIRTIKERTDAPIEVDGGVTLDTIKKMYDAGARYFISGSFVRKATHPKEAEQQLLDKLQ